MSIPATILDDPKIKALFIESLRVRKVQLAEEDRRIDATLRELEGREELRISLPRVQKEDEKGEGQRRKKGEAAEVIAALLRDDTDSSYTLAAIAQRTGIAASTAWRALQGLERDGKVHQPSKGIFYWMKTDLPVAGGNGEGAET